MTMFLKYAALCLCLFGFALTYTFAQDDATWCELEADRIPRQAVPTPIDIESVVGGIVNIPQGTQFKLPQRDNILFSADGSRAVIGIMVEATHAHELIVVDMVNRRLIYRITSAQIHRLHPVTNIAADAVWVGHIQWAGNSHKLAIQTSDFYASNPEYRSPPDDLHIIDESGQILTLLSSGTGGNAAFSPDGNYVAVTNSSQFIMISVNDGERRNNLFPTYEVAENMLLIPYWESNTNLLVFYSSNSVQHPVEEITGWQNVQTWRIFTDAREPRHIATFQEFIVALQIAPHGEFISYVWAQDINDGIIDLYASIATFDANVLYISEYEARENFGQWLSDESQNIMRFTDLERKFHHIAPCGAY